MVENVDVLQDWVKPWKDAIGSIDELLLQKDSKPAQKTKFVKKCVFWSTLVLRPCVFLEHRWAPQTSDGNIFMCNSKRGLVQVLCNFSSKKFVPEGLHGGGVVQLVQVPKLDPVLQLQVQVGGLY